MSQAPAPEPSDEQLLRQAVAGDVEAVEALTRRYWPAIQRYCTAYLRDGARADDVVQETFAKLTGGATPAGPLRPWLYRLARNRCLDILRRQQRSPTHHHRIGSDFEAPGARPGPATEAVRRERSELIRIVIDQMPDELRDVLMLKFYEGLSRAEIAEVLEVSEPTVKGRLVRASKYLEDELR